MNELVELGYVVDETKGFTNPLAMIEDGEPPFTRTH
jgi:hypothetical protein